MPAHIEDFIDILAELCEKKQLKATITESFKGGLLTGAFAVFGGLFMGPVGLAVGGLIGGGLSARLANKKFQSVAKIIKNMSSAEKKMLYDKVKYAFRDFGIQDITVLSMLVLSQKSFEELALKEVINFLSSRMSLTV